MDSQNKSAVPSDKVNSPWYGSKSSFFSGRNENNTDDFTCSFQSKDLIVSLSMENGNPEKVIEEEEEDDGHGPSVDHPTSYGETLMHLLRGNIGSGVFAMGDAFKNAGIVVAPIGILILGIICVHCSHLLLVAADEIKRRTNMDHTPGFAQTVELCFSTSHPTLKKIAKPMRTLVNIFLCITQLGFCCVYFVFVSTNIQQILNYYEIHVDLHYLMAMILVPILLTCLVRNLKFLAPLSTIANLLMLVGIIIAIYYCSLDLPHISERKYVAEFSTMPLFFGTALFAFEGIGLVLPLQKEMKKPQQFASRFGVLNIGLTFVICLYATLGFLSYLKYGEDIAGSITLNLPVEDVLAQAVKIIIPLAIILTFALQFYIPIVITWPRMMKKYGPFKHPIIYELLYRTVLVFLTFVLAEIIPYLGSFISLVGAISSTALAFIFPAILDLVINWSVSDISPWKITKNILIILFGIIGTVTGTYESIVLIIRNFREENLGK